MSSQAAGQAEPGATPNASLGLERSWKCSMPVCMSNNSRTKTNAMNLLFLFGTYIFLLSVNYSEGEEHEIRVLFGHCTVFFIHHHKYK